VISRCRANSAELVGFRAGPRWTGDRQESGKRAVQMALAAANGHRVDAGLFGQNHANSNLYPASARAN
jgi:hypothetical protein